MMDALLDLRRDQAKEHTREGRPEAARQVLAKALSPCDLRITRAKTWLARDPREPDARLNLVTSLTERAVLLAELGRRVEALKDADHILALGEGILFPPEVTRDGSTPEAAALALAPDSGRVARTAGVRESFDQGALPLYKIARVYALLATFPGDDRPQSTRDADRAIRFLRQALAQGFRRKTFITEVPALVALRSRADFQAILNQIPPRVEGAIEGEALPVTKASGPFEVAAQALPPKRYVGRWSGDTILIGSPQQPGDWVDLALPIPADGNYRVMAHLIAAPSHGVVRMSLDGKPLGSPFDGFSPGPDPRSSAILDVTPSPVVIELGTTDLRKGTATLRLEVLAKNEQSSGFSWGLDCLVLRPLPDTSTAKGGHRSWP
jgi:hypothetical protein